MQYMDQLSKDDFLNGLSSINDDLKGMRTETAREFRHLHTRLDNVDKTLASLGDHLVTIEDKLETLSDLHRLDEKVERMRAVLREKLGVEV